LVPGEKEADKQENYTKNNETDYPGKSSRENIKGTGHLSQFSPSGVALVGYRLGFGRQAGLQGEFHVLVGFGQPAGRGLQAEDVQP